MLKSWRTRIALLIVPLALVAFVGVFYTTVIGSGPSTSPKALSGSTELTSTVSSYPGGPDPAVAAGRADFIVEGKVVRQLPARWRTPGEDQRPQLEPREILRDPSLRIWTPFVIEVSSVLKGANPSSELIISELGGKVGNDEITNSDGFVLSVGDQVFLFLEDMTKHRTIEGEPYRWRIINRYIVNADGSLNGILGDSWTRDEFTKEIQKGLDSQ